MTCEFTTAPTKGQGFTTEFTENTEGGARGFTTEFTENTEGGARGFTTEFTENTEGEERGPLLPLCALGVLGGVS